MAATLAGGDVDPVDQAAQLGPDLVRDRLARRQRVEQRGDAGAVGGDDLRMQRDHRDRFLLADLRAQAVAFGDSLAERIANVREVAGPVGHRVDQPRHRGLGLPQAATQRLPGARALTLPALAVQVILAHQQRLRLGREQPLPEPRQHAPLQLPQVDPGAVGAAALVARAGAAEPRVGDHGQVAAACAALHQPGQQVDRATTPGQRRGGAHRPRVLRGLPQRVADDPELGDIDRLDVGAGVGSRNAVARLRIADHPHPVVDHAADIDRVVQDADLARAVADDRRRGPLAAARGGDAVGVQIARDGAGAAVRDILGDDAADDRRLLLVDAAAAGDDLAVVAQLAHDVIAVAEPARRAAARDRPALAAPDLVGEVLQEQRAHRPLQADVQLVDRPFAQRLDADIGEAELLVDGGDVGLVAGDAVQRLGQDDVERARPRVGQHAGHAGPPVVRAGDGEVGVDLDDRPPLAIGAGAAVADLVFGRAFGLPVGGEAGVDGAAGHGRLR